MNLVLGDTLFEGLPGLPPGRAFMQEDWRLCTRTRHHQQKLVLFLSAMRHYAEAHGDVEYRRLDPASKPIALAAAEYAASLGHRELWAYEPHDAFFKAELEEASQVYGLELRLVPSPGFLTSTEAWRGYRSIRRKGLMADFYRWQRERLGILLDPSGGPVGGRWSFDESNRKPAPKGLSIPTPPTSTPDAITQEVIQLVERRFSDHPGRAADFAYPVTRCEALAWMDDFLDRRLGLFGPYEDAMVKSEDVLFHSLLSPLLNLGLLAPRELIDRVVEEFQAGRTTIESAEGFIRQVIGWREFMKGISLDYEDRGTLFKSPFGGDRLLGEAWWNGTTGLSPLDHVIQGALRLGWRHHIERLMVAGSAMLMSEVDPHESFRWFSELFIDSADWVMAPNVFGMSQFADGGLFASKPYISGSAYLRKMGDWAEGPWTDVWDGLYWRFLSKNLETLSRNPRMALIVKQADRLPAPRKERIFSAAQSFIDRTTLPRA